MLTRPERNAFIKKHQGQAAIFFIKRSHLKLMLWELNIARAIKASLFMEGI